MAKTASGGTRADDVQEHLRADILGGRRSPGERLKFPELCEQHEVRRLDVLKMHKMETGVIQIGMDLLDRPGRAAAHPGHFCVGVS